MFVDMSPDGITDAVDAAVDALSAERDRPAMKPMADDLFVPDIGECEIGNDLEIVPEMKKKPKIVYI